jgi:protein SDA1
VSSLSGHVNLFRFLTHLSIRYLTYHQLKVTQILVALAQSIHELVPPEDLHPVVTKIANEFVNDGVSSEVIAAGINAIREICRRQPWVMDKKRYLLKDLIDYRKSKDKGVITASRGLLQLYREVAPGLLERRDRVSMLLVQPSIFV